MMATKDKINLINTDYSGDSDKKALERAKKIEAEKSASLTIIKVSDKLTIATTNKERLNEYIKEYGNK